MSKRPRRHPHSSCTACPGLTRPTRKPSKVTFIQPDLMEPAGPGTSEVRSTILYAVPNLPAYLVRLSGFFAGRRLYPSTVPYAAVAQWPRGHVTVSPPFAELIIWKQGKKGEFFTLFTPPATAHPLSPLYRVVILMTPRY